MIRHKMKFTEWTFKLISLKTFILVLKVIAWACGFVSARILLFFEVFYDKY